jgi:Flagellar hook-length control protein FliK
MDLTALIKAVLAPMETQLSGDALRDLKLGDKLTGRVLSVENDGRALVDLGRTRVLAQMAFAVTAGELLNLQVVENGAVLHFRAEQTQNSAVKTPVPQADLSRLLTHDQQGQWIQIAERMMGPSDSGNPSISLPQEIINALIRIGTLFKGVSLAQPVDQLAGWIKNAVEDRGVFFEKRLADKISEISTQSPREAESNQGASAPPAVMISRDIKPQLMILKKFLDQAEDRQATIQRLNPREAGFLRNCVDTLLDHVTQQQAHAVARWETGAHQQVLVHLWPFQELRAPVELKVYYPPRKNAGDDSRRHRIAILLDMNRLGPVRVDLSMIAGNVHIAFFVVSEAIKACFQKEMHSVETALAGKFQQLQLDIFVSREKIDRFHREDLDTTASDRIDINA